MERPPGLRKGLSSLREPSRPAQHFAAPARPHTLLPQLQGCFLHMISVPMSWVRASVLSSQRHRMLGRRRGDSGIHAPAVWGQVSGYRG